MIDTADFISWEGFLANINFALGINLGHWDGLKVHLFASKLK